MTTFEEVRRPVRLLPLGMEVVCWRGLSASDVPAGEPTLPIPDQVETFDARAGKGRAIREARGAAEEPKIEEGIKVGRYQLLELVGAGGMGMVWGAWDPELERRVALKLVRSTSEGSHERMLREGQVLAKLSHPNLVPIFDVGVMGGQVYLVMEWIRGVTLREYGAKEANPRALLAAYRQAGEGLAAAHHAGVVHRDFKPDNAVRGEDGRVRVLDFGLAHSDGVASDSPGAGTPRYMPPEQASGLAATAASDQYAFCVSLREALEAAGGVPSWIGAIIERGTAEDPAQRFASMDAVLAALARDPARRWRRGAIGAVIVAGALGAFAFGRSRGESAAIEPCTGAEAELATSWSPAVRARVVEHLRLLGPAAEAEAARVATELDDYAKTWIGEHRRVCLANVRREVTPAIHEARMGCLTRTRSQLAAAGELMATVDAAELAPAMLAASSLPDSRGCVDEPGTVLPPPAAMVARVKELVPVVERALVRATAKQPDAIHATAEATRLARATGYVPLIARALLAEGRARANPAESGALFSEAMRLAFRGSDEVLAVEAYARWIYAGAVLYAPTSDSWDVMVEVAERLGRPGRFARSLMYSNRGLARLIDDDREGARAMFERAQQVAGDSADVELVSIAQNLAQLETDPAQALRKLREVRSRFVSALGSAHPHTLIAREQVALVTPEREAAAVELETIERGLQLWQQAYADFAWHAAWIADESGDVARASASMARIQPDETPMAQIARAYIAIANQAPDAARSATELEQLAAKLDTSKWWDRNLAADALTVVARVKPEAWEQVLALRETKPLVIYHRALARARRMVAGRWAVTRPVEAAQLATLALPWYRAASADGEIVVTLERIASRRVR